MQLGILLVSTLMALTSNATERKDYHGRDAEDLMRIFNDAGLTDFETVDHEDDYDLCKEMPKDVPGFPRKNVFQTETVHVGNCKDSERYSLSSLTCAFNNAEGKMVDLDGIPASYLAKNYLELGDKWSETNSKGLKIANVSRNITCSYLCYSQKLVAQCYIETVSSSDQEK